MEGSTWVQGTDLSACSNVFMLVCLQGNDDIYICGVAANGLVSVQHAFSTGSSTPSTLPLVPNVSTRSVTKPVCHG